MARKVSYSQYQMYFGCPEKYKLTYVTPVEQIIVSSNINLIFGLAMHEVVQSFLQIMYSESKKKALEMDLDGYLYDRMIHHFKNEKKKSDGVDPASQEEMIEFYNDGKEIIKYLKSKVGNFYNKSSVELVGIELQLDEEVKPGVFFIGYIDVILKDKVSGEYIIIDIKTSTRGWSDYKKKDDITSSQMLIYKKLYSDKFGVPLSKIKVEYHILKRKLPEETEYPVPRISKFIPANGSPTVNKAWISFQSFVNTIFDETGERRTNPELYQPKPGKLCDWCELKEFCSAWK